MEKTEMRLIRTASITSALSPRNLSRLKLLKCITNHSHLFFYLHIQVNTLYVTFTCTNV
jgi:hypothetical protein